MPCDREVFDSSWSWRHPTTNTMNLLIADENRRARRRYFAHFRSEMDNLSLFLLYRACQHGERKIGKGKSEFEVGQGWKSDLGKCPWALLISRLLNKFAKLSLAPSLSPCSVWTMTLLCVCGLVTEKDHQKHTGDDNENRKQNCFVSRSFYCFWATHKLRHFRL